MEEYQTEGYFLLWRWQNRTISLTYNLFPLIQFLLSEYLVFVSLIKYTREPIYKCTQIHNWCICYTSAAEEAKENPFSSARFHHYSAFGGRESTTTATSPLLILSMLHHTTTICRRQTGGGPVTVVGAQKLTSSSSFSVGAIFFRIVHFSRQTVLCFIYTYSCINILYICMLR